MHALAESVPDWIRRLIKIKGNLNQADKEISALYTLSKKSNLFFGDEIKTIYAFFLFHQLNRKPQGQEVINEISISHKNSPMVAFLKSSFAVKQGQNELALKLASESPTGDSYLDFKYLDFIKGKCLLHNLDPKATTYLLSFVNDFKGQHYIKEAYQKLAWSALVFDNDPTAYKNYIKKIPNKGKAITDEDAQALREYNSGKIPNTAILRSRLLFDGGKYKKSLSILEENQAIGKTKVERLEYLYRLARCNQALLNFSAAIKSFKEVIKNGQNLESYFVCNAALQLGYIYEALGQYDQAILYFNLCLKMNSPEYKNSMHQRAKSGIERLK
jgi:tetratricopeptide (TPR) repeat protein